MVGLPGSVKIPDYDDDEETVRPIHEMDSGITRIFTDSKNNQTRQIRMTLRLSGISRPQKRDQTEKYN